MNDSAHLVGFMKKLSRGVSTSLGVFVAPSAELQDIAAEIIRQRLSILRLGRRLDQVDASANELCAEWRRIFDLLLKFIETARFYHIGDLVEFVIELRPVGRTRNDTRRLLLHLVRKAKCSHVYKSAHHFYFARERIVPAQKYFSVVFIGLSGGANLSAEIEDSWDGSKEGSPTARCGQPVSYTVAVSAGAKAFTVPDDGKKKNQKQEYPDNPAKTIPNLSHAPRLLVDFDNKAKLKERRQGAPQ